MDQPRAKVFISCGQNDLEERKIAAKLSKALEELGYQPYVATQQQTLKGLKENIFNELASSEYFLFIDFKREKLGDGKDCRGSLFSHQELAIASFRDMDVIAFQEKGVKKKDGIMASIQANCEEFSNRDTLVEKVLTKIKHSDWRPDWKNQLIFEKTPYDSGIVMAINALGHPYHSRYFYITIKNLNPYHHARNCIAFLEAIDGHMIPSYELRWKAFNLPNATILPRSTRDLDAFFLDVANPSILRLHTYWNTQIRELTPILEKINNNGGGEITYLIVSDNFPSIRATFCLQLSKDIHKIQFEFLHPSSTKQRK